MTNKTFSLAPRGQAISRGWTAMLGALALAATLFPLNAWGTDNPKLDADQAGSILPLPPVPYLESMQWMNWKLSPPAFKIDTLLAPAGSSPGSFQLPAEDDRIRMS
jgi:hypothetical protein